MIVWGLFEGVFSTVASLLLWFAVLAIVVVIVLDNRSPVKTLAWVLVLCFVPIIGLIFYFFFGQDTRKERLISKKGFARLTKYPMMEFQMQKQLMLMPKMISVR